MEKERLSEVMLHHRLLLQSIPKNKKTIKADIDAVVLFFNLTLFKELFTIKECAVGFVKNSLTFFLCPFAAVSSLFS